MEGLARKGCCLYWRGGNSATRATRVSESVDRIASKKATELPLI
jgi:hypothetical protein